MHILIGDHLLPDEKSAVQEIEKGRKEKDQHGSTGRSQPASDLPLRIPAREPRVGPQQNADAADKQGRNGSQGQCEGHHVREGFEAQPTRKPLSRRPPQGDSQPPNLVDAALRPAQVMRQMRRRGAQFQTAMQPCLHLLPVRQTGRVPPSPRGQQSARPWKAHTVDQAEENQSTCASVRPRFHGVTRAVEGKGGHSESQCRPALPAVRPVQATAEQTGARTQGNSAVARSVPSLHAEQSITLGRARKFAVAFRPALCPCDRHPAIWSGPPSGSSDSTPSNGNTGPDSGRVCRIWRCY